MISTPIKAGLRVLMVAYILGWIIAALYGHPVAPTAYVPAWFHMVEQPNCDAPGTIESESFWFCPESHLKDQIQI